MWRCARFRVTFRRHISNNRRLKNSCNSGSLNKSMIDFPVSFYFKYCRSTPLNLLRTPPWIALVIVVNFLACLLTLWSTAVIFWNTLAASIWFILLLFINFLINSLAWSIEAGAEWERTTQMSPTDSLSSPRNSASSLRMNHSPHYWQMDCPS